MNGNRYAPDFALEIDGEPIPAALRASLAGVRFDTGFECADRVELTVVNEDLRWLDHRLFYLDNRLTLSLGYAPDALRRVFVGEIVGQGASFPSSGAPTLTVNAQDRRHRLQEGNKARWFGIPTPIGTIALPDLIVSGVVSLENGLVPLYDPVGAAIAVLLGGIEMVGALGSPEGMQKLVRKQVGECDHDFLKRLAKENGWDLRIEHRGDLGGYLLRFMSPLSHLEPDLRLRYGDSLVDFNPRISKVGQVASISAYIWVAPIKTTFTVTIGLDWDRQALTLSIMPTFLPMQGGASDVLLEEPVTPFTAPRKIVSQLIPRLNKRLTGRGTTIGDPRIRAGAVVQLEGLGTQFGGLYRVTSATHVVDRGGYLTKFEARKEIWFGSIPAAQQGAVPARLRAPFVS